eukprot:TRINITY_DN19414_c0_g1_i1.p1 TRINITY_DN19414_c0_g1~~TRINITY_DN19414_c0_g1_i1.p1  ORF type:complete len:126 (-),score=45.50 TRINITY_DN19414_c0_g1_i1:444-821(-)
MIRRPPRSTQSRSSAASDVYKRQPCNAQCNLAPHYTIDLQVREAELKDSSFVKVKCIIRDNKAHRVADGKEEQLDLPEEDLRPEEYVYWSVSFKESDSEDKEGKEVQIGDRTLHDGQVFKMIRQS